MLIDVSSVRPYLKSKHFISTMEPFQFSVNRDPKRQTAQARRCMQMTPRQACFCSYLTVIENCTIKYNKYTAVKMPVCVLYACGDGRGRVEMDLLCRHKNMPIVLTVVCEQSDF